MIFMVKKKKTKTWFPVSMFPSNPMNYPLISLQNMINVRAQQEQLHGRTGMYHGCFFVVNVC